MTEEGDDGIIEKKKAEFEKISIPLSIRKEKTGVELWTEEKRVGIREKEKIVSSNSYETGVIYDENGEFVFEKKGDSSSVKFDEKEIRGMKGKILTHNHPNDSCFSCKDINMLRRAKLSELRAITSDGVYILRRSGRWNAEYDSLEKIEKRYYEIDKEISKIYGDVAAREGKTIFYYDGEIQEKTVAKLCEEIGIVFRKEKRNGE